MKTILVFGAGGHAKVVIDIIRSIFENPDIQLVDNVLAIGSTFYGYPVVANDSSVECLIQSGKINQGLVAIGDNILRAKLVANILSFNPNFQFITAVDKSAIVSPSVRIGEGTVVMPGCVINAETKIGRHCIINTKSSIDHDCTIENFASLSPNVTLAGTVRVEENVFLGTSATVIPGKSIGAHSIIGAGAVVINDIEKQKKALGVPARVL